MGLNSNGQLGTGDTANQSLAIPVMDGVTNMAIGSSHVVYMTSDGNLWGLGRNNSGQLGLADTSNRTTPVLIDTAVAYAAAGGDSTFYVKTDGSLYQATAGGPLFLTTAVAKVFTGVRGDHFYTTPAGALWGWGRNENVVLTVAGANKSFVDRVMIDSNVADAAVGWDFLVYRKTDGSMWGTGENEFHQIDPSTTGNMSSPFQIEASGVVEVAAGNDHVVYRDSDNSVHARGRNHQGQLGDGTFTDGDAASVLVDGNVSTLTAGGNDSFWVTLVTGS
jgi:alpha-tubulin suppressor-like RCC1 family protein